MKYSTRERKRKRVHARTFAYDLILLFFVTWVSQIYLVAGILKASLKSTDVIERMESRRGERFRRTVILIRSRNLVVISPISFVPLDGME